MYEYTAWGIDTKRDPLGVVDGDTLNVGIDVGFEWSGRMTLRLYGINAPEMKTPEGKIAKLWAIDWFHQHCPDGRFIVNTIQDKTEKYGRYLAVVTAPDHAVFNNDIVAAGHAVIYNVV